MTARVIGTARVADHLADVDTVAFTATNTTDGFVLTAEDRANIAWVQHLLDNPHEDPEMAQELRAMGVALRLIRDAEDEELRAELTAILDAQPPVGELAGLVERATVESAWRWLDGKWGDRTPEADRAAVEDGPLTFQRVPRQRNGGRF
ncbi:hypothetical protein [Micromonospora sp. DT227]|uniref:hypothetical protein n=1 Tax=Micromonospora sp. DT227 TaxID=3393433 RepID=UPI003CF9A101